LDGYLKIYLDNFLCKLHFSLEENKCYINKYIRLCLSISTQKHKFQPGPLNLLHRSTDILVVQLLQLDPGEVLARACDHVCVQDPSLSQPTMLERTNKLLHQIFSEPEEGFACLIDFSIYFGLIKQFWPNQKQHLVLPWRWGVQNH